MDLYDVFNEKAIYSGGAQLNVWDSTLSKYVLLVPLETVPVPSGSVNTFDINVLTSASIGKVAGKTTIDDKDTTFMAHRDNFKRLMEVSGKQMDYLVSLPDFTGYKFAGELRFRLDDLADEKATGTLTIIASSVDENPTLDCYDMMAHTCAIDSQIPTITKITSTTPKEYELSSTVANATFTAESTNSSIAATITGSKLNISITGTSEANGVVYVTASAADCASWTTSTKVFANITTV